MRSILVALLVTACSSSATPARAPTAQAAPSAAAPADAAVVAVRAPHRCASTVWPSFDTSDDAEPDPLPEEPAPDTGSSEEETVTEPGADVGETEFTEAGRTLDDKLAQVNRARPDGGVCDTRHRDTLEASLLAERAPTPRATPLRAWDRKAPLASRDLARATLGLTAEEEAQLARDGLVVPARLAYDTYTTAYYDVHRAQLPVFVSLDSILHAVYASHDHLFATLEEQGGMATRLDAVLGAMHCGLASAAASYPAELSNDVDLYLTVARSLLAGQPVPSELGAVDAAAAAIVELIAAEAGVTTISLFGRVRAIDTSQYTPRGHYAGNNALERYFRAVMWLSRTEFNLVSRDSRSSQPGYDADPRETPREAVVALALAELADRTGASKDIALLDDAWAALAGKREDVSFAQLGQLRAQAGITTLTGPDRVAEQLRAAIGPGFVRTVNVHPMPNVDHLPVIATLLGPRITPDTIALGTLTSGRGPALRGAEVGFMLGQDRALAHLGPQSLPQLAVARKQLADATYGSDLYSAWLQAIRALSARPAGATPSFMDGHAYQDLRLDTALAAYGQLRHNHVLIEAQVYDQGGCEIPDGYVEPAPATYRALAAYATIGKRVFAQVDPKDTAGGAAYFTRLEKLMRVLAALSDQELANRPLSATAKRFLATIVERREATAQGYNGSFPIATFDGWYLDLFPSISLGLEDAAFVVDYATFDRNGQRGIHYLGAKGPRLGVFAVDTGGPPRIMVGPVARAFEYTGPLEHRLDDAAAPAVAGLEPWAASYVHPAPAEASFAVEFARPRPGDARRRSSRPSPIPLPRDPSDVGASNARPRDLPANVVRLDAPAALGPVTIELLDHHFMPMVKLNVTAHQGRTDVKVPTTRRPIEALRITVGAFQGRVVLDLTGAGSATFGATRAQP